MSTTPALCRGLAVVAAGHGLLIEGGPRRQWLPGASAATLLPRVLALLDGRRDTAAICGELGLTARQLRHVLGVLGECGLLEEAGADGAGTAPGVAAPAHVATYLSRSLGVTGGYLSTGAVLAALGESAVALVGDCPALDLIEADLRETGIGVVTRSAGGTLDAADLAALAGAARSLVVACDDGRPDGVLERTVAACAGTGLTVLRIAVGPGYADVGPAFRPGDTACPRCLRRGLAEAGWDGHGDGHDDGHDDGHGDGHGDGQGSQAAWWLLAGLAAGAVIATLAQVSEPAPAWQLTRVWLAGHDTAHRLVTPYPDCAACGCGCGCAGQDGAECAECAVACAYEWQVADRLAEARWQGRALAADEARIDELKGLRPVFPSSPARPLARHDAIPEVRGVLGVARPAARPGVDAGLLAGILMRTVGGRLAGDPAGPGRRWAPSGGNLASAGAYVITRRELTGLPGNCLRYDDLAHALVAIRPGIVGMSEALAGTDLAPGGLDAVVVLVAEASRVAGKYGLFAYRLVHLDAGCAATQLAAVAAGYGLGVSLASSWDDQLARFLDLVPGAEFVTVVAGLSAMRRQGPSCP
jgi:SagB-type dehydrogenase family enzyme